MKLSGRTLQILKNFSTINQSLWFKQGNVIITDSPVKTIKAKATVEENFDMEFGIYDLSKFLGVISLFDDPEINITPTHLVIENKNHKVNFTHVSKEIVSKDVDTMYNKSIVLPSIDVEFEMTVDHQMALNKAINVLQLPHLCVSVEQQSIVLKAMDCTNPTSNKYQIEVASTNLMQDVQITFKSEYLKLLTNNYHCYFTQKGVGHFVSSDVEYWITAESNLLRKK